MTHQALSGGAARGAVPASLRWLGWIGPAAIALLLLLAIADMLIGVFLRYVMSEISDYFDLPYINYFWVEEVGEFALAWLTMIGGAIGITRGIHFRLQVLTHRFPMPAQRVIARLNAALIVLFGALAAYFGWRIALLNSGSSSPGLSINLFWLYISASVGGALIVIHGLIALRHPELLLGEDH